MKMQNKKNAALLIGDLALSSESDAVFHAYQTEDTRFVKRGLFNCFKIFKCGSLCGCFRKRYEELSLYEASDDERKSM